MSNRSGPRISRVPVCRGQQGDDPFACADRCAAEVGVLRPGPGGDEVCDAEVAQQFLDRVGEQSRVGLERGVLVGVFQLDASQPLRWKRLSIDEVDRYLRAME